MALCVLQKNLCQFLATDYNIQSDRSIRFLDFSPFCFSFQPLYLSVKIGYDLL